MTFPSINRYFVLFLFFTFSSLAQTGPGGVGNTSGSSTLRMWVRDAGVTVVGGGVSQWSDQSGYGNHLTQVTAANRPTSVANIFNGFPVVRYTGASSQFFNPAFNGPGTDGLTVFMFVRGSSYQSLIRYQNNAGTFVVYPWEIGGGRTFITSSDGGTGSGVNTGLVNNVKNVGTGRYLKNTANGFIAWNFGTIIQQRNSINATLPVQPFYSGRYNPGASEYPTCDVAEMIVYWDAVNEAQRIIIENYLAAKYDTLLAANDVYTMDNAANGNYDYHVAGIGQASDGSNHTDSRGTGIVQIRNPTGLANGEFFIWGCKDIANCSVTNTNMPIAAPQNIQVRFANEWRPSEVGDVGNTDIRFDLAGCGPVTVTDLRLLIDRNNNGLFSDEVNGTGVLSGASLVTGSIYQFTGVNIADGQRFTLASINSLQTPLPIGLLSFNGRQENDKIKLSWSSITHTNDHYFKVYALGNTSDWKEIGTVQCTHEEQQQNYESDHVTPAEGNNYYKIGLFKLDGTISASEVISVPYNGSVNELKVYPNPSTGKIYIESRELLKSTAVEISDVLGKTYPVNFITQGEKIVSLTTDMLSPGTYFIKYRVDNDKVIIKKIRVD